MDTDQPQADTDITADAGNNTDTSSAPAWSAEVQSSADTAGNAAGDIGGDISGDPADAEAPALSDETPSADAGVTDEVADELAAESTGELAGDVAGDVVGGVEDESADESAGALAEASSGGEEAASGPAEGDAADTAISDDLALAEIESEPEPEPEPQRPIRVIALNEKLPAAAGHRAFWRYAGYECRAMIENATVTATCRPIVDPEQTPPSNPKEILLRQRFVSQGEAVAFMQSCLSFDPDQASEFGFEVVGRATLPQ